MLLFDKINFFLLPLQKVYALNIKAYYLNKGLVLENINIVWKRPVHLIVVTDTKRVILIWEIKDTW